MKIGLPRTGLNRFAKSDVVTAAVVTTLLAVTWLPRLNGPIDLRWDGATYYILGTSLFEGHGYRYLNEPGDVEGVVWPPLLPVIVAVHQAALGTSSVDVVGPALRRSFIGIWAIYIAMAFLALRRLGGRTFAVAGTVITGLHMSTIWLSDRLYTDLPFALAVTAFLVVAWRWPHRESPPWLMATAAFLLRTAGAALFVAWIADAVLARRWGAAARRLALALLPVIAWQAYIHQVEQGAAYKNPPYAYARADYSLYNVSYARNMLLRDPTHPELGRASPLELPGRMLTNLRTSVFHLGEAVSLLERDWAVLMSWLKGHRIAGRLVPWRLIPVSLFTFGACVLAGALLYAFSRYRLLSLVLAAYIAMLALLPTDYHWPRYLAGVAPLIAACFLAALTAAAKAAHRVGGFGRALALVPLGVIASAILLEALTAAWYFKVDLRPVTHSFGGPPHTYRMFTYDEHFAAFDQGLDWIRGRARSNDVLVSSMPHWAYLRTGARAVMPPFETRRTLASELLASVRPRYVVIDSCGFSPAKVYALPVVAGDRPTFSLAWKDEKGMVQVFSANSGGPSTHASR